MRLSFKQSFWTAFLVLAATATQAQKLPVPGEKNPDWKLQKTEELSPRNYPLGSKESPEPVPMPSPKIQGGMLNEDGEWHLLYDSKKRVRYELAQIKQGKVRVQNLRTGTMYTYVHRKGAPLVIPRP